MYTALPQGHMLFCQRHHRTIYISVTAVFWQKALKHHLLTKEAYHDNLLTGGSVFRRQLLFLMCTKVPQRLLVAWRKETFAFLNPVHRF